MKKLNFTLFLVVLTSLVFFQSVSAQECPQPSVNNGGFEVGHPANSFALYPSPTGGWANLSGNSLEFWGTGWNGVPAFEGTNFMELNAFGPETAYQDVATIAGQTYRWEIAHRGRLGYNTATFQIGPSAAGPFNNTTMTTGMASWVVYSGTYIATTSSTRIRIASVTGGSSANFLDDFSLTLLDTDSDGVPDCSDNCVNTANADQADADCDGIGDVCDNCPGGDDNGPCDATTFPGLNNIPAAWKCGNNNNKVHICHNGNTLCVAASAVQAHLNHGDFLGPCSSCGDRNGSFTLEQADQLELDLFPNPANNEVTIDLNGLGEADASLTMFDNLGRIVLSKHIESDTHYAQFKVSLNGFAAGKYFVRVVTADEVQTKNFVISR